jgi:allantoin racemase
MLGHSFSVVSTGKHSIPNKYAVIRKYNLEGCAASVRAPKEDCGCGNDEALFMSAARAAIDEDMAEVIVLGCAGMTGLDKSMSEKLGVPVLDGVICALIIASGLVKAGLSTSKIRRYEPRR